MPTTITRTWTCSWSNVPSQATLDAQGKAVMRAMVNNYISAGYTVDGSSNGTTGGMDGVNRWSSDADLVWAAGGVAHSWIVLKSPSGFLPNSKFVWICFKLSTGATSQHLFNGAMASAAFTGGNSTTDPTSPTNVKAFASKQFLPSSTVANCKYHCLRNTVGDVINFVSQDGTAFVHHVNCSLVSAGYPSASNYPWLGMMGYVGSAPGPFLPDNTTPLSGHGAGFLSNGTPVSSYSGVVWMVYSTTPNRIMASSTLGGSTINGTYPALPAFLYFIDASSNLTMRGTLVDVTLGPYGTGVVNPTVEPSLGTPATALVGGFWVPCGGVVPNFI